MCTLQLMSDIRFLFFALFSVVSRPLLCSVFYILSGIAGRQNVCIHRALRVFSYHNCLRQQRQHALCLLVRTVSDIFGSVLMRVLNVCVYCRGVFSTIFLWFVDVDKSRVECEEFIRAEADRKAFETNSYIEDPANKLA